MKQKDKAMWVQTLWEPLEEMNQSPLHSKREGIRVAAYCRVSLDVKKKSQSLESQVSYYTHLINDKDNWSFIGIYFDNLVTGRKADLRTGFTRMLRHCEEGKIDLILVKNVSRFSRNVKELIEVVERLKELNVTVYFETEKIESTRSDTTYLLKTYASIAQGEIEAASQAIEWGHEKRMLRGQSTIRILYGYQKVQTENGMTIMINEEQAKVVREIYQMYLEGMSINGITAELTRRKTRTYYNNTVWEAGTIRAILSNTAYAGNILTRKRTRDLLSNRHYATEGARDQYYIENCHPAIISQEIFEAVQERRARNRKDSKPKVIRSNPLSKRVVCGNCGRNFGRNTTEPWDYFKCSKTRVNMNLCASPTIRIDAMKTMMINAFHKRFNFGDKNIINTLQRLLIKINLNDHFEFHRLKALTQIQLAKKLQYTDDHIQKMEREYLRFEEQLVKIEGDRKFRLEAIEWLNGMRSIEQFKEEATLEHMRAWIFEMVIYSKEDYTVKWIDGKETEIGNCVPIQIEIEEPIHITSVKGGDIDKDIQKGEKNMAIEKKVLVKPNYVVDTIRKQLANTNITQVNVPMVKDKKIKVAAYVRVSSEHEEQEMSLKTQYSYYVYRILKDPNYELAGIYVDDGKSGTTTKGRTGFNKMMEDCKAGKIDLIITKSISRFARNSVDTLTHLRMLEKLDPKVDVWFERENLRALDKRSNLLINLLAALSQEESNNISESIAWGRRRLAQRGIVNLAVLGYGYQYGKNKEWVIKEEEAEVVRKIYAYYIEGMTTVEIGKTLAQEEILSPTGKKNWNTTTIKRILSSEIYRGNYIYQRYHTGADIEKKRLENKGELPMYFIEQHHQGIVDSVQWEKAQEIAKQRGENRKNIKKYADDQNKNETFTKKIYCSQCGNVLGYRRQVSKRNTNWEQQRWRCYEAMHSRCDVQGFRQEYLQDNFSHLLMDIKFDLDFQLHLHQFKDSLKITVKEEKEIEELENKKQELNQQLYKAVEEEIGKEGKDQKRVDSIIDSILEIRNQLERYVDREERLEATKEAVSSVLKELEECKSGSKNTENYYVKAPSFKNTLFEQLIEKAFINDVGQMRYRFYSGLEWSTSLNYINYQDKCIREKAKKKMADKEAYFKGPEITAMLQFCREPKSVNELREFLGKYKHKDNFRKRILTPLLQQGVIKMTKPEVPTSRMNRYYSVGKEKA